MEIVPLVLAAGAARRLGTPKAGVLLEGRTALEWILDACRGLAPAVVVAGAHPVAAEGARVIRNPDWERGRATSIRAGLAAIPEDRPFLLWPVDVPLAGAAVPRLLEAWRSRLPPELAWVPSHERRRGHPVLLGAATRADFLALADDAPARDVIRALAARGALRHVEVHDPAVLWDIDTPEDLARMRDHLQRRRR